MIVGKNNFAQRHRDHREHRAQINLFLLLALLTMPVAAQTSGTLEGVVLDAAGSVVQAADVRIVDTATMAERRMATDSIGRYSAVGLALSNYDVEVTHPGFGPSAGMRWPSLPDARCASISICNWERLVNR